MDVSTSERDGAHTSITHDDGIIITHKGPRQTIEFAEGQNVAEDRIKRGRHEATEEDI